jgi:hypothetical protein
MRTVPPNHAKSDPIHDHIRDIREQELIAYTGTYRDTILLRCIFRPPVTILCYP